MPDLLFTWKRVHVIQRGEMPAWKTTLFRLTAILVSLLTGGIFLWCLGVDPISAYGTMLSGALGSVAMQRETAKIVIPLCITSLGVMLAFRMRFWNIGAEGQICVGAIAASYFAYFYNGLPSYILLPIMGIAGFMAGGLWGLVPAYFKTRFGTNETLFTLMMNYVAVYFIQYLREDPWRDPGKLGYPAMPRFVQAARFPVVLGVHAGWIAALALAVILYVYVRHTKQGYELTAVGENINTARYAGMPVKKIILRTVFLSAAVCGLSGMLQVSGADKQLTDTVAGGTGFTAITVAWLARLSSFGILTVSVLFGILEKGCSSIQSVYKISNAVSNVLQGIILFFVLGSEFFIQYKPAIRKDELL
jgi:general nucleoside transport system permease protein